MVRDRHDQMGEGERGMKIIRFLYSLSHVWVKGQYIKRVIASRALAIRSCHYVWSQLQCARFSKMIGSQQTLFLSLVWRCICTLSKCPSHCIAQKCHYFASWHTLHINLSIGGPDQNGKNSLDQQIVPMKYSSFELFLRVSFVKAFLFCFSFF